MQQTSMNSGQLQHVQGAPPEPVPAGRSSDPQPTSTNPEQPVVPGSTPSEADTNRSTRAPPGLFTTALRAYPVLELLLQQSHRTDIQNLARTNSEVHAILAVGGVSLTGDSTLWASCPKMHKCFWCGMPLCQRCAYYRSVAIDEINQAISNHGPPSTPLFPQPLEPLRVPVRRRRRRILVCADCLGKCWGDWVDTNDILPLCTVCRLPWDQPPPPPHAVPHDHS